MLAELAAAPSADRRNVRRSLRGCRRRSLADQQDNPDDRLNQTEFTQPALLAAHIALWRLWQAQALPQPAYLSGHSLGEYAALVAAGALTLKDGPRTWCGCAASCMQAAVPAGTGAMAAVLGAEDAQVERAVPSRAQPGSVVVPANFNSPGQIVIGGHADAVDRALAALQAAGIRKTVKLAVSVPSHTPLMREAALQLQDAIAAISLADCRTDPVIHNVDATRKADLPAIQQALVEQLYLPCNGPDAHRRLPRRRSPCRGVRSGQGAVGFDQAH